MDDEIDTIVDFLLEHIDKAMIYSAEPFQKIMAKHIRGCFDTIHALRELGGKLGGKQGGLYDKQGTT